MKPYLLLIPFDLPRHNVKWCPRSLFRPSPSTLTFCRIPTYPPKSMATAAAASSSASSRSPLTESRSGPISEQEWRSWGTGSPAVPAMVLEAIQYLQDLERESNGQMSFGGNGGKLAGDFKVQEDKKHRAAYNALSGSEQKLQFFSARQIACRLLGSRGYLCQKCWLAMEDCMCSKVRRSSLCNGIRFWVYMHPKDFLRQNNTGKLLWQVFDVQSAALCLFGIAEHEKTMWNEFKNAGRNKVWCLYPNKSSVPKSVEDCFSHDLSLTASSWLDRKEALHFILIDGTWSNSNAMVRRLKEHAKLFWGDDELSCISLAAGTSVMHKLRPQPSWDRTCTAAAAAELLIELHLLPSLSMHGLDKQAEAVEDALEVLLEALTRRRLRMGRSITRKMRNTSNFS
ncbi:hypothetical protein Dimus_009570 [Dionaea muscipula]